MLITKKLGLRLAITVLVCASIYWIAWQRRPDLFVVQEEINLYPFASLEAFLWTDNSLLIPAYRTDAASRATDLLHQAKNVRDEDSSLTQIIRRLDSAMRVVSADLEHSRSLGIDSFTRRELEPFERQRIIVEEELAALEARLDPNPARFDPLQVDIANKRVELAKHNIAESQKRLEIANYVLRNYAQFARPNDLDRWRQLFQQGEQAQVDLLKTYHKRGDLRVAVLSLLDTLNAEREAQLGLLDFLYFSIGVSTTTTFGDIIPNHWITRTVVTIQLLVSILIVGLFVNSISVRLHSEESHIKPLSSRGGGQSKPT